MMERHALVGAPKFSGEPLDVLLGKLPPLHVLHEGKRLTMWVDWCAQAGIPYTRVSDGIEFSTLEQAIHAARKGAGLAIVDLNMIEEEIGDGTVADPIIPSALLAALATGDVAQLAASVGNCLSDSLLFALRKFKQQPEPLHTEVSADVGRNAEGRLRVLGMRATLTLGVPAAALEHLDRVLASFEQYCTVTQSVAQGFPVEVQVVDATGVRVK
mgnify:CR=1 FL=1